MTAIGFSGHDHSACISDALASAEARCRENGWRLTPMRRRVLELLLSEHRALGAYDLLKLLAEEGQPRQPPVVYRALAFLTEHGFAHKIERLNSYVACAHPGSAHSPIFLICSACDKVAETTSPSGNPLEAAAREAGFAMEAAAIEASGTCPECRARQNEPAE